MSFLYTPLIAGFGAIRENTINVEGYHNESQLTEMKYHGRLCLRSHAAKYLVWTEKLCKYIHHSNMHGFESMFCLLCSIMVYPEQPFLFFLIKNVKCIVLWLN